MNGTVNHNENDLIEEIFVKILSIKPFEPAVPFVKECNRKLNVYDKGKSV